MNGLEALKALEEGKKVRFPELEGKSTYIIKNEFTYLVVKRLDELPNRHILYGKTYTDEFHFYNTYLFLDNWEIYEEPEERHLPCPCCECKEFDYGEWPLGSFWFFISCMNNQCSLLFLQQAEKLEDAKPWLLKRWNRRPQDAQTND